MLFQAGTYLLSFDLLGSQRGTTASTTVSFGTYDQMFTLASGDDTTGIILNHLVTLNAPGYLLFASDTPGNIGNLIDNVVVSTSPSTAVTPEPSSLVLLGTGALGLAGAFRRRWACAEERAC